MTVITIEVDNSETKFIKNLLKKFDFVKIREEKPSKKLSAEDKRILKGIDQAVEEIKLYKQGKIKLQDALEMIDEVEAELKAEEFYAN
ncbi:MAG: hypothetical protein ACK4NY_00550 [Spirosomataceae bacterium]